jgi:hypothetical protein
MVTKPRREPMGNRPFKQNLGVGEVLPCMICGRDLKAAAPGSQNQPSGGTYFLTYGNYGSTVFDPLGVSVLEISVCDGCLRERAGRAWEHPPDRPLGPGPIAELEHQLAEAREALEDLGQLLTVTELPDGSRQMLCASYVHRAVDIVTRGLAANPEGAVDISKPTSDPQWEPVLGPVIHCGQTYAHEQMEQDIQDMREGQGFNVGADNGCGKPMRMGMAYRCVECGRWFHQKCAEHHFTSHTATPEKHRWIQVDTLMLATLIARAFELSLNTTPHCRSEYYRERARDAFIAALKEGIDEWLGRDTR